MPFFGLFPGSSHREDNAAKYENQGRDEDSQKRSLAFIKQKGHHAVELRGRHARHQTRNERNNRREW